MRWIDDKLPPVALHCAYCGHAADFPHVQSFEYDQHVFSLYECGDCRSLMYFPQETRVSISRPFTEAYKEDTRLGIKYYVEAGYSAEIVMRCALAAFAATPAERAKDCLFMDVGAGIGLASVFVAGEYGAEVLTIEPSYSGELGREMLGIEIHTVFFEELPPEVMDRLAAKSCLLHLNSVIEHLRAPAETLRGLMRLVQVEALAANVPDRDRLDFSAPFASMLPALAPDDHLHIPTREGMIRFLAGLGFAHQAVVAESSMLIAVGARQPIVQPDAAALAAARRRFLGGLLGHANPMVAGGAAGRLIDAAAEAGAAELPALQARLLGDADPARVLQRLAAEDWDTLPFHLATSSFALAKGCMRRLDRPGALAWLDVVEAAAARLARDHPVRALQSLGYRWSALQYRAHVLALDGDFVGSAAALRVVIASADDRVQGAMPDQIARAQAALAELEKWRGWWAWAWFRLELARQKAIYVRANTALHTWYFLTHLGEYWGYWFGYVRFAGRWLRMAGAYRAGWLRYHATRLAMQAVQARLAAVNAVRRIRLDLHLPELAALPGRVALARRRVQAWVLVAFRTGVARHRDRAVLRGLAGACRKFLRAYDNQFNLDPASNGEGRMLRRVMAGGTGEVWDLAAADGRFAVLAASLEGVRAVHVAPVDAAAAADVALRCAGMDKVVVVEGLPAAGDVAYLRVGAAGDVAAALGAAGAVRAVGFWQGPEQAAARVLVGDVARRLAAAGFLVFQLMPDGERPVPAGVEDFGGRVFVGLRTD